MQNRKCALYGRVSTVRQALVQDGGLDTQFELMERYVQYESAKGEGTWHIHDRFREEAYSGKDLERPEFKRMMNDVEAGLIDTVIVHKIDRITRSLPDFYTLWSTFERHNVQFVSLHEKFDTTTAIGRAMLKLILVFAELEREQTGERTAATMENRARLGLWNGGVRPLGFDVQKNQEERAAVLIPNEEETRIAREHFFEKCVELGSAGKVVKHLAAMGIREPVYVSRRGKQRGGGQFTKPKVVRLLTNPIYVGKIEFRGEIYPGQQQGIIAQYLYDEVQRILERNRERRGNYRDQRTHLFLLQGLIRCGRCGSFMTPKTSIGRGAKKHFYYQCTKNAHSSGTACDAKYVRAESVEEFVLAQLRKWTMSSNEVQRVVAEANAQKDSTFEGLEAEERALLKRLAAVRTKLQAIVQAVESGGAFSSLAQRMGELEGEQKSMEEELASIREEKNLIRQKTISTEAMLATYQDFPSILDALSHAEDWHCIKTLIAQHVEVIDWHQDEADPTSGTVDIALFEEAQAVGEESIKNHPDASVVNGGASGWHKWLPDKDSNLGPCD